MIFQMHFRSRLDGYCFLALAWVIMIAGCSRTVTGGFTDSQDSRYRVYARVFGKYGRAFTDNTWKSVRITICRNDTGETILFSREYRVHGSDVGWDAKWDERDDLTIDITDCGPGVSVYDARKNGTPARHICSLQFERDSATGTFHDKARK